MMKFMAETVKPQMAALQPEAGGFGCTGCHTMKRVG
jgi:hypothetical protein